MEYHGPGNQMRWEVRVGTSAVGYSTPRCQDPRHESASVRVGLVDLCSMLSPYRYEQLPVWWLAVASLLLGYRTVP